MKIMISVFGKREKNGSHAGVGSQVTSLEVLTSTTGPNGSSWEARKEGAVLTGNLHGGGMKR